MNITCSTSLLMAYSRNSDMSLPRLSYKRLQFRLGYVLSLGWLALEKVCCHYTGTHGSLCGGPRGKILKSLANSQWETLAWQQPHKWDLKQIFPLSCQTFRWDYSPTHSLSTASSDTLVRTNQLNCSQIPELQKSWENKYCLNYKVLG